MAAAGERMRESLKALTVKELYMDYQRGFRICLDLGEETEKCFSWK